MIKQLNDTPNTLVAFWATREVTKEDFDSVVLPAVSELVKRIDKLNFLLVLDTSFKKNGRGAWLEDAMLGLNNFNKWNRAAIVTESGGKNFVTEIFGKIVPGEFRTYPHSKLDEAIEWVGEQTGALKQVFQEEGDSKE